MSNADQLLSSPWHFEAGRVGDNSDQLLAEHVEGVARKAGGLDVALVHGACDCGAGDEVGAIFGKKNAFADGVHVMACAADALHAAGHRGRGLRSG